MEAEKRRKHSIDAREVPRADHKLAHRRGKPLAVDDSGQPEGQTTLSAQSMLTNRTARETQTAEQRTSSPRSSQDFSAQLYPSAIQYPLLEAILAAKGLALKAIWPLRDVAIIFDVSVRTNQEWARDQKLTARDLPGRGKFLSQDLEDFLVNSKRATRRSSRDERMRLTARYLANVPGIPWN